MRLENLDNVRDYMVTEIQYDIDNNALYLSKRLNEEGQRIYPSLLLEAATSHDAEWLIMKLTETNLFKSHEERNSKGKIIRAKVPANAVSTLAYGEFNRFYLRGLCQFANVNAIRYVEVVRARETSQHRPESDRMIGQKLEATELLRDLQENPGVDTALGLPPGPNSGLSARISTD